MLLFALGLAVGATALLTAAAVWAYEIWRQA